MFVIARKRGNRLLRMCLMRNTLFRTIALLCMVFLFFLFSCSSDKTDVGSRQSQGQGAASSRTSSEEGLPAEGSYAIEIVPANATKASRLYLVPKGVDLAGASIEWLVNGEKVLNPNPNEFDASNTRKNDNIQVRAIVQDREAISNIVQIRNSPPEISRVKIMPEIFKPGDALSVDVSGTDRDGDDVTFSYEWTKNGEPAGNNKQIASSLKRGDKVDVKITPFDGEAYGRSIILHREIVNLPPMILEDKKVHFDGNMYTCQIKATDPDGDTLTYSLKSAPSGMTINPSTGLIKWNVPIDFLGKASFIAGVADGQGGETTQELTLEIREEQKKQSARSL